MREVLQKYVDHFGDPLKCALESLKDAPDEAAMKVGA